MVEMQKMVVERAVGQVVVVVVRPALVVMEVNQQITRKELLEVIIHLRVKAELGKQKEVRMAIREKSMVVEVLDLLVITTVFLEELDGAVMSAFFT